jgi:hypothetical protein
MDPAVYTAAKFDLCDGAGVSMTCDGRRRTEALGVAGGCGPATVRSGSAVVGGSAIGGGSVPVGSGAVTVKGSPSV